eukprot:TRINITY_DN41228_c0_g1_i1.p1 TRINITY_DN41228_c0_g1~~TRINITY_DN41228_c0_g1_i1.p1  ORF type:complete len:993 (-),score=178.17 TRINITY_DN41228_c0_g1_i1:170-3148(-)
MGRYVQTSVGLVGAFGEAQGSTGCSNVLGVDGSSCSGILRSHLLEPLLAAKAPQSCWAPVGAPPRLAYRRRRHFAACEDEAARSDLKVLDVAYSEANDCIPSLADDAIVDGAESRKQHERRSSSIGRKARGRFRPEAESALHPLARPLSKAMLNRNGSRPTSSNTLGSSAARLNTPASRPDLVSEQEEDATSDGKCLSRVGRCSTTQVVQSGSNIAVLRSNGEPPFNDSIAVREKADRMQKSRHRLQCQRTSMEAERRQAVTWREHNDRRMQICELRWVMQETEGQGTMQQTGRLVPTPVENEFKAAEKRPPSVVESSSGAKLSDLSVILKSRRPAELRMKILQKLVRKKCKSSSRKKEDELAKEDTARKNTQKIISRRESESNPEATTTDATVSNSGQTNDGPTKGLLVKKFLSGFRGPSFDKFLEKEEQIVRSLFARHDTSGADMLSQDDMISCLFDLGLQARTAQESKALRRLVSSVGESQVTFAQFSELVILKARNALTELRRPRVKRLFHEIVPSENCYVSVDETVDALRRSGTFFSGEVCKEAVMLFHHSRGRNQMPIGFKKMQLDEQDFIDFFPILQEKADRANAADFSSLAKSHDFSAEERQFWKHDLVNLHNMFHEYDPWSGKYGSPTGLLSDQQIMIVIRESGYMPEQRHKQSALVAMVQELLREDGMLSFKEFIRIMYSLKEFDQDRWRRAFKTRCGVANGALRRREVLLLLFECGVVLSTADDEATCEAALVDANAINSDALSCDKFVVFGQLTAARLRGMQRERERQFVSSAGWSDQQFQEYRNAFQTYDEDISEFLKRSELMKAIELLKGRPCWQSSAHIKVALTAAGIHPTKQEIKVNFLMFLQIIKMLEENESCFQDAMVFGYDRDRVDRFFGVYQDLDPSSASTGLSRDLFMKALVVACRKLQGAQLQECVQILNSEPANIDFNSFLRILKVFEPLVKGDFENFLCDIAKWQEIVGKEGDDVLRHTSGVTKLQAL